jgi:hypothetical protein
VAVVGKNCNFFKKKLQWQWQKDTKKKTAAVAEKLINKICKEIGFADFLLMDGKKLMNRKTR